MLNSNETYIVEQFIDSNKDLMSYHNLSLFETESSNCLVSYNLINEYLDDLKELCVEVELSEDEYHKYKYKPKLLSYDVYGSTELFFIILIINNICSVKEFDFKVIKMIKIDTLNNFLSYVYNNEKLTVEQNRIEIIQK